MNRCPITYQNTIGIYSEQGLKLLSKNLKDLKPFALTAEEQVQLATKQASKLSIQGIQPKLSIKLNAGEETFDVVETGGTFILKPPHQIYNELPQNEDLTMRLAKLVNIDVPLHGLIYNIDHTLSYIIKRFDRLAYGKKLSVEDFAQLMGYSRDTKYESSMEQVISVIEKHCTFPMIEKLKLFRLVLFNFLVGNEDMHLKNFSLIRRKNIVELSPSYDLLNTTIVLDAKEEIALPIRGKKSKLKRQDLIDYLGIERMNLSSETIENELKTFQQVLPQWNNLIAHSFLSKNLQEEYQHLISKRWKYLEG